MKIYGIVLIAVVSFPIANTQRFEFDRTVASAKSKNTESLSSAFQEAIKGSDKDLNSSKSAITLEQDERLAKWSNYEEEKIVIQGTLTVDPININETEKIKHRQSQIDTDKFIQEDLKDLNR